MNILFYIPRVDRSYGGIFQYSLALLETIAQLRSNTYYLYSHIPLDAEFREIMVNNDNIKAIPIEELNDISIFYKLKRAAEEFCSLLQKANIPWIKWKPTYAINKITKKYAIKYIHSPYDDLPRNTSVAMISTIHDVQELHYPQYFTPKQRINRAINKDFLVENSETIVCSYAHVKNDIESMFPESRGKVEVCLLNMQRLWIKDFQREETISVEDLGISGDFILYPAATWEHKNHVNLIRAFLDASKVLDNSIALVCTGKQTDYYEREIASILKELGDEVKVRFLGVVSEIILFSLYQACKAVVVPTKYEAGSFPLMESMMMGIPVICSNVTSLPETIRNDEFVFDPDDIDAMKDQIISIVADTDFISRNLENSELRKKQFTSENDVQAFRRIYESG